MVYCWKNTLCLCIPNLQLNFQKLRELHEVADKCGDSPMADFIGRWAANLQVEISRDLVVNCLTEGAGVSHVTSRWSSKLVELHGLLISARHVSRIQSSCWLVFLARCCSWHVHAC